MPLDKRGLAQAQRVAETLNKGVRVDRIYCSDLKRAFQTAHIVYKELDIPLLKTCSLRERNYGRLEGRSWAEIKSLIWSFESTWTFDAKAWCSQFRMEPRDMFKSRLSAFLKNIGKKHPDESVLVVTHGGAMRMLLSLLDFEEKYISGIRIKNTEVIVLKKAKAGYQRAHL